jgi:hypothetical protein
MWRRVQNVIAWSTLCLRFVHADFSFVNPKSQTANQIYLNVSSYLTENRAHFLHKDQLINAAYGNNCRLPWEQQTRKYSKKAKCIIT